MGRERVGAPVGDWSGVPPPRTHGQTPDDSQPGPSRRRAGVSARWPRRGGPARGRSVVVARARAGGHGAPASASVRGPATAVSRATRPLARGVTSRSARRRLSWRTLDPWSGRGHYCWAGGVSYPRVMWGACSQRSAGSPPTPARRARQRADAAMARGREDTWPVITRGRRPDSPARLPRRHPGFLHGPVSCAPMRPSARRLACGTGRRVISGRR